ncbi:anti-sigma factor [Streptomyces venezuelae]|uniref:Regulator of SigK n=1 Tax=Streptomyces venezuelae TaxID=54571 RepID=A0A5P2BRV5_STRVZ|nr:anti-sigma factor [Streptomyces venezuelae]QES33202.1 anti-sigma factor [Streptomyces venezuelae]
MNSAADLHTLTGAYAADALDDAERARFEEHLALCPSCDQEVRELTATVARLALASAVTPRPALKDEVLRRIGTVRQDVPEVRRETAAVPGPAPRRTRGVYRWALAACVAAAVGLGGTAVWQHQQAEDARDQARQAREQSSRRSQELAAVLAAPDAKTRTGGLTDGARGTVVASKSLDKAVFIAAGMAPPPKGKVYQLWFDDSGSMRSAGLMDPDRTAATVLMRGGIGKATGMGITVEPAGGSDEPTSSPVALMELPT